MSTVGWKPWGEDGEPDASREARIRARRAFLFAVGALNDRPVMRDLWERARAWIPVIQPCDLELREGLAGLADYPVVARMLWRGQDDGFRYAGSQVVDGWRAHWRLELPYWLEHWAVNAVWLWRPRTAERAPAAATYPSDPWTEFVSESHDSALGLAINKLAFSLAIRAPIAAKQRHNIRTYAEVLAAKWVDPDLTWDELNERARADVQRRVVGLSREIDLPLRSARTVERARKAARTRALKLSPDRKHKIAAAAARARWIR